MLAVFLSLLNGTFLGSITFFDIWSHPLTIREVHFHLQNPVTSVQRALAGVRLSQLLPYPPQRLGEISERESYKAHVACLNCLLVTESLCRQW